MDDFLIRKCIRCGCEYQIPSYAGMEDVIACPRCGERIQARTGIPLDPPKETTADVLKKVVFWWVAISAFGAVLWILLSVWGQLKLKNDLKKIEDDARIEQVRMSDL